MSLLSKLGGLLSRGTKAIGNAAKNVVSRLSNAADRTRNRINEALKRQTASQPVQQTVTSTYDTVERQNEMFRYQMRNAGTPISPYSEQDRQVFWRATQPIWEHVPVDMRYDAILDYFYDNYGMDNLSDIMDYIMDDLGNDDIIDEFYDTDMLVTDDDYAYNTDFIAAILQVR